MMSINRLPWAWVQQHQILRLDDSAPPRVVLHAGVSLSALAEVCRTSPDASIEVVSAAEFQQQAQAYYQQQSPSQTVMEELGQEMDLRDLVESLPEKGDLLDSDDGAPVIRLINAILAEAVREGASDIHIEPFEKQLSVRFRTDGMLRQVLTQPVQLSRYLVSRIKVMSQLDIAERRLPQDGRFTVRVAGCSVDVRVSTLPTSFGERVVLRLLDKNTEALSLENIGMNDAVRSVFTRQLALPHGIILVTGPTGSGKSTTLYAALRTLWTPEKNILTIEDPVEYELEGIGQMQVNPRADVTFARGLRAILRQDPDVVMIGEIRDSETARIAVQASLTGHLVLSTLHTNTASGAIERLRDMGIEPFLLASAVTAILAQRLVRKLCPHCRVAWQPPSELWHRPGLAGFPPAELLWKPGGCEQCNQSGYRGRTGIHELIVVDEALRAAIARCEDELTLMQRLGERRTPIAIDGIQKASAGLTTLEEVLRVTRENH